jgi:hemerythrin-like domain-containing protein
MNATDELKSEHRVIERVLSVLESGAARLEDGKPVRPGLFLDVADFAKGFTDGCHHMKEENVLFPTMEKNGVPNQGGPIGVMLSEHEAGRAYIRSLRDAVTRWQSGEPSTSALVTQTARGYAALLRQHIFKEDNILFPMADRVIPSPEQEQVWEGFEHIEHEETGEGVHEKYLALAEALEKEIAA